MGILTSSVSKRHVFKFKRPLVCNFETSLFGHLKVDYPRKMKISHFFWNLKWFQVSAESLFLKLLWFHRFIDHLEVFFFLWPGFKTVKIAVFWLKITICVVSSAYSKKHVKPQIFVWVSLKPCTKKNERFPSKTLKMFLFADGMGSEGFG